MLKHEDKCSQRSRMLDYRGLSDLLSIPVGTLHAWVHQGKIPFVRLGPRTVRFDQTEIAAWIDERRAGHKPPNE